MSIAVILLVVAIILWFLAALPLPIPYVQLGWLGLAFYGLSLIVK